ESKLHRYARYDEARPARRRPLARIRMCCLKESRLRRESTVCIPYRERNTPPLFSTRFGINGARNTMKARMRCGWKRWATKPVNRLNSLPFVPIRMGRVPCYGDRMPCLLPEKQRNKAEYTIADAWQSLCAMHPLSYVQLNRPYLMSKI